MWDGDRYFLPLVFDGDPRLFHGFDALCGRPPGRLELQPPLAGRAKETAADVLPAKSLRSSGAICIVVPCLPRDRCKKHSFFTFSAI